MICPFCENDTLIKDDDGNRHNENYDFCFNCMNAYSKQQIANKIGYISPKKENEAKGGEGTVLVSKKEIIIYAIVLFIVVLICSIANIFNRL
jgi:uncharacterized membrane protein YvbJ